MDKKELELIHEMMGKLIDEMQPGEDDFSERLGRKKPAIAIEIEKESPMEEDIPMSMDDLDSDHSDDGEEMDPLAKRLMKLRGR